MGQGMNSRYVSRGETEQVMRTCDRVCNLENPIYWIRVQYKTQVKSWVI